MLTRRAKSLFFALCAPVMAANGALYRAVRAPRSGTVRVQLGPGQGNYLPGWINVDANAFTGKCDLWADLRNPLPFRDSTVDVLYSHHVVEHLPDLAGHFREMFRVLKPGGVFRVGGPNGDMAMRKYLEGDAAWFSDFPVPRRSIGGRLENFIFCSREHLTVLTFSFLQELAEDAGFVDVARCEPARETRHPGAIGAAVLEKEWESAPDAPHTLIVEGRKPA